MEERELVLKAVRLVAEAAAHAALSELKVAEAEALLGGRGPLAAIEACSGLSEEEKSVLAGWLSRLSSAMESAEREVLVQAALERRREVLELAQQLERIADALLSGGSGGGGG